MIENLPSDFEAGLNENPMQEVILAVLKMDSGDIHLSDFKLSDSIESQLGSTYYPFVESFGEMKDGGEVNLFLNPGNLESKTQRISLIRSDETKSVIDPIINEGIHNKRIEFYRWFVGMTSQPVLIDILFCQDPISLREDSMLFSFDCVSCLCTENPKLWSRSTGEQVFPVVVGKAENISLVYLDDNNPPYTELTEELEEGYTGIIGVDDTSGFPAAGVILINGEKVSYSSKSATTFNISSRASLSTEEQRHRTGSKIFPNDVIYKYGVCAGPVGSLSGLSVSGEPYSGTNAEFKPDLNPAQVHFRDRLPYVFEDQSMDIIDDVFYGDFLNFSSAADCIRPSGLISKDGKSRITVPFRRFSENTGDPADYWFIGTTISLPATPGDSGGGGGVSTYAASENILNNSGHFSVSQSFGDYLSGTGLTSTAWREFRINSSCPSGEEGWTMISPVFPDLDGFVYTEDNHKWAMVTQRFTTKKMDVKLEIFEVHASVGGAVAEYPVYSVTFLGGQEEERNWRVDHGDIVNFIGDFSDIGKNNVRLKMKFTCLNNNSSDSYAYIRVGSSIANGDGQFHYGLGALWNYLDAAPSSWASVTFGKNLSARGSFTDAKARVKGIIRNSENKAKGTLKIYENGTERHSVAISNGDELDTTINLSASDWVALSLTEIKIEVSLDYALIYDYGAGTIDPVERTDGFSGIDLEDGVQWLVSYVGNNLDNINVSYASNLTCDAVSIHGENPTPADQIKYMIEDYTSYTDFIHAQDFIDRSTEYAARSHYLNGLLSGHLSLQDAYRAVLKEGFARIKYNQGKIKILNYITDQGLDNDATYGNSHLILKKRGYETTGSENVVERLTINYNKNNKTGNYENIYSAGSGPEGSEINLDLTSSPGAVEEAGGFLFSYKNKNLKVLSFECLPTVMRAEKGDLLALPDFLDNETMKSCKVISSNCRFGQGKNNKITTIILKCLIK